MTGISRLSNHNVDTGRVRRRICLLAFSLVSAWLLSGCASNKGPETPIAEPAIKTMSAAEQSRYQQGLSSLAAGDLAKAVEILRGLSTEHADHLGIWINLATAYYHSEKLDEASAALKHAQQIKSDIPEIHNLSGLIAVERGDYASAEDAYLAALEINDDYSDAHHNLGLLYDIFYQDLPKAIVHYDRYLTLTGSEDQITAGWVSQLKRSVARENQR